MPDIRVSLDITQEAWAELDDIYEAFSKDDKEKMLWWLLEDLWDDVKDKLKDWYEDEK